MGDQGPDEIIFDQSGYFNRFIKQIIVPEINRDVPAVVSKPVLYCLDAPGKRLRPVLCQIAAGVDTSVPVSHNKNVLLVACSIECIHTYSLIHDDLPAMDDDKLRRGRPTAHIQFSEWAAILAGDALNTYAFELLSKIEVDNIQTNLLIASLAKSSGMNGMIAGQALDLYHEKKEPDYQMEESIKELKLIHTLKTAKLISSSCEMGAIAGGADKLQSDTYKEYGEKLGLLFQITDDLLDIHGNENLMGKAVQKDSFTGKWTYPGILGVQESIDKAGDLKNELQKLSVDLKPVGQNKDFREFWSTLPEYILKRKK